MTAKEVCCGMSTAQAIGRWPHAIATIVLLGSAAGCGELLDISSDPHTVDGNAVFGLEEGVVGASADLYYAYDTYIVQTGRFGDEFFASSLDRGQLRDDQRDVTDLDSGGSGSRDRSIYSGWYGPQQKAVFVANLLQQRIRDGEYAGVDIDSPEYARVSMYDGFAKTWIADGWCSAAFNGEGPEYSSNEVYALAEAEFTEAIDAANAEDEVRQGALVGRARVRLILGDDAGALADAMQVDPAFVLLALYSTNTVEQNNRAWWHNWGYGNISVDYRVWSGLTIDDTDVPDPRVQLQLDPIPAYDQGQPLWAAEKISAAGSPLVLASGDEAQMIIAEIEGGETAVEIINATRARNGVAIEWSPGADPNEIRDKVIDERARTLFLEGTRMGDLRRYITKFGLNLFPTETPQGDASHDNVCWPLPLSERQNNPGLAS